MQIRQRQLNLIGIASSLVLGVAVAVFSSEAVSPGPALAQSHTFPRRLDAYLKNTVRLTDQERSILVGGAPVTKLLDSDPATEVAVFGAVWVAAPPELYVRAVTDIENFEKGENFRITKKISDPPRPEDFAQLVLPDDDIADLRECQVGNCAIKLSQNALERVRKTVDWSKPTASAEVNALVKQLGLEYAKAYREGGNSRLAE